MLKPVNERQHHCQQLCSVGHPLFPQNTQPIVRDLRQNDSAIFNKYEKLVKLNFLFYIFR